MEVSGNHLAPRVPEGQQSDFGSEGRRISFRSLFLFHGGDFR